MLKILQARLQQYVNCELSYVQAGFRKGRGTRDQIANIHWIMEKAREFQKSIYFCFLDYAKAFDCVDHNKLWKILKEMGIPDHLSQAIQIALWCTLNVTEMISGSSAFSKTSLNIWKFTIHILLKPDLENLSITLLPCEMSAIVQ